MKGILQCKVDEGFHIKGKGHSIDIIVRDLKGIKRKAVVLELRFQPQQIFT